MANKSLERACSSSKLNLNDLSDDILVEILRRLPCRQASRCKSVSKRWNFLIWSPQFFRRFIKHQIQLFQSSELQHQHCTFLLNPHETLMIPKMPSESLDSLMANHEFSELFSVFKLDKPKVYHVLGYSNSLLLWGSVEPKDHSDHYWCYVLNIVTKHFIRLPRAPSVHIFTSSSAGFISDAMEEEATAQGVGAVTKFFVVHIPKGRTRCKVGIPIHIFSSKTGCWEKLFVLRRNRQVFLYNEFIFPGVPHNGMLYFYGLRGLLVYDPLKDVSRFHAVSNPPNICENKPISEHRKIFDRCFGVCCGNLRLCEATHVSYRTVSIKVWELRGFDEETGTGFWHSVHDVCLGPSIWESNVGFCRLRSLYRELCGDPMLEIWLQALHPCNGDILYFRYRTLATDNYFSCDMKTKSIEETHVKNRVALCLLTIPILPPWWPTTPRIHA